MIHNTAVQTPPTEVGLEHATVKACTDGGLIVHGAIGVVTAQAAVGCLIQPVVGDRVLISRNAEECFVLTVLARNSRERSIDVPGDLSVTADHLYLCGRHEAAVDSHERLRLRTPRLAVTAGDTDVQGQSINVCGEQAQATFGDARLVATAVEIVSDRIAHCARQVVRRVEEVETLHVGNLVQRVRENLISRSKRTSITASKDVHVDGERIHMG